MLHPISDDEAIQGIPAWSARVASNFSTQYASVVVSSNLWPGAFAVGYEKKFANIYIGWGTKYSNENYTPDPIPASKSEYEITEESGITEAEDPSAEEEKALEEAKKAAAKQEDGAEEGAEEEPAGEEEDE
eukprot:Sdes_comp21707_c0_seq1m20287